MPDSSIDLVYADMIFDDLNFTWMKHCARLLKPTGVMYVHTDKRSVCEVRKSGLDLGLQLISWIIWPYNWGGRSKDRWPAKHDDILFFASTASWPWFATTAPSCLIPKTTFMNEKSLLEPHRTTCVATDVWSDIGIVHKTSKENLGIEWQKPVRLLERIILAHAQPGAAQPGFTVLDPFCGTGTTAVVCTKHGLTCHVIDKHKIFIDITRDRVKELG